jgi:hypothetical protein
VGSLGSEIIKRLPHRWKPDGDARPDVKREIHWLCQFADDITLPFGGYLSITRECRKHLFVAEVLAPGFELLGGAAELLAQVSERLPKAVRIEVGQTGTCERILENLADGTGAAPVLAVET